MFYPLRVFQSHHKWFLPPTIGIRASFVTKHKFFGRYPNYQSCQKQVWIIPQRRAHPYELTAAKIRLIGHRGDPHAPPEDPVTVAQSHPRAPEEEDECRPRAPYPSRVSRAEPRLTPSLQPIRRIFPRIFPFQAEPISRAAISRSRADRIFHRIFPVQPQRTARRPESVL